MTVSVGLVVLAASAGAAWMARARFAGPAPGPHPPLPPTEMGEGPPGAPLNSRGRLVYQVYCVACHGAEGHGDGPAAAGLKPPPRDFASHDLEVRDHP